MYITLKNKGTGVEINLISGNMKSFQPSQDDKDAEVTMVDGDVIKVQETCRQIRFQFRKQAKAAATIKVAATDKPKTPRQGGDA